MNNTPINQNKRGRAVQLYAILSLLSIGLLVNSVSRGDFLAQINKVKALAQTAGTVTGAYTYTTSTPGGAAPNTFQPEAFSLTGSYSTDTSVTPQVIMGDATATQVKGVVTLRAKVVSENIVFVISYYDNTVTPKIITLSDGIHRSSAGDSWEYSLDTTSLKNGYYYLTAAYYSPNRVWLNTGKASFYLSNVLPSDSSTSTPVVTNPLAPYNVNSTYTINSAIYPKILSGVISPSLNGATSYTQVKGKAIFHVDIVSDNLVFVLSNRDGGAVTKVLGTDICAHKLSSGIAWECEFDTTTISDGYYVLKATYASSSNIWINTNNLIFTIKNIVPDFLISSAYGSDTKLTPNIKQGSQIVTAKEITGVATFEVSSASDNVVFVLVPTSATTNSIVLRAAQGVHRITGTDRWECEFNISSLAGTNYDLKAAYYANNSAWLYTAPYNFSVIKKKDVLVVTTTTDTPNTVPAATASLSQIEKITTAIKPTEYQAVNPTTTNTNSNDSLISKTVTSEIFKPSLRLVVNNRQITDMKHSFDSEELELRVTSLPARSVQFFAYAVDGAFKPVLKEIGAGAKDEILSRDGKEVWTLITDMRDYPTGNFRLFSRVHGIDGTINESQSIPIVVQHMMQMEAVTNDISDEAPVLTQEARQSILNRVTDPSACQNRQECEVFCSNNNNSQGKCLSFVRVKESQVASNTIAQIKLNQIDTFDKITSIIPDLNKRIEDIKYGKMSEVSSSSVQEVGSTTLQISSSTLIALNTPLPGERSSMMDIIPMAVVEGIISIKDKIDISLPEEVKTARDLHQYCGTSEHETNCAKAISSIAPELKSNVEKQAEVVRQDDAKTVQLLDQRSGARSYIDTDGDGITDFDEVNFYHTDPSKRDTNGDGYSDGASLLGQTSPLVLGASTTIDDSKIVLSKGVSVENPKITGATQDKQFQVTSITPIDFKEDNEGKKDVSKVSFKGKALPNSFVKIFLYSDPIVVTVKTDDNGNWSYVLDKTLPDGAHTAYVAMADGGGRILAKSAPLPFVKEASAITVNSIAAGAVADNGNTIMGLSPITLIALFVGLLGLALSVVGVVIGVKFHGQNKPDITTTA